MLQQQNFDAVGLRGASLHIRAGEIQKSVFVVSYLGRSKQHSSSCAIDYVRN